MATCSTLREEFQWAKFGFKGVRAERFCNSQWRTPVALYMVYRLLLMLYTMFWLGYTATFHGQPPQAWGAYLTNWTYIMLNIYLILHFMSSLVYHCIQLCDPRNAGLACQYLFCRPSPEKHAMMLGQVEQSLQTRDDYDDIPGTVPSAVELVHTDHPPFYMCLVWIWFNAVSTSALMVTIVFFVFLFPMFPSYPHIDLENLQVHLLNSVIIVIEHLVSAVPYRLLHVIYPFIYGLIYMTFSVIYWAGDHNRVMYPILNWNKPAPTVGYVFLIGFVFVPLLHGFFFLLYKVKMAIHSSCCSRYERL